MNIALLYLGTALSRNYTLLILVTAVVCLVALLLGMPVTYFLDAIEDVFIFWSAYTCIMKDAM